jgi:hypothetical protein
VSTRRAAVERDFSGIAALGFTAARWFLFADGRAGIVYDADGLPAGPDPHLFADLDVALEIARDTGVRITFVLLDHRWMFAGVRDTIVDAATGALFEGTLPEGRARVLIEPDGHDALFDRIIQPLVTRYAPGGSRADLAGAVLAYEFMNEPDFVIEEWEGDLSRHVTRPLPFAALTELIARLSALVHRTSPALTTLGGARLRNLWAWDDDVLGLDLLQVHTYPDRRRPHLDEDLFGLSASELGVRRPVVIGEFPGDPMMHPDGVEPPDRTVEEYLEFALRGGYAGAWPWSFSGTDAYRWPPHEALRRFAARHPELVNPRART